MANPSLQFPTNPHFFQPLLPGSDAHLKIPITYFSKHIQVKNEHTTAKLRSEASDKTWEVEMDGRRLTEGWKDFATAHDLRIGDIVIFEHQGDMVFNVTPFGPSFCEIQYANSHIKEEEEDIDDDDDEDNNENQQHNIRNVLRNKNLKSKREPESSLSHDYCFVANVTASNLKFDTLYIPKEAARSKALNKRFREIIAVNEEGNSWTLNLRFKESEGCYYIRGRWKRFCRENRQKEGDSIVFNLVGDGKSTPMICICSEEDCSELMNKERKTEKRRRWVASSSSRQNRLVTIILTEYNIKSSKLILPVEFTTTNGIKKEHKKIILVDKHGVKKVTRLVYDGPTYKRRGLGKGWKHFCEANGVFKIGESFVLELIWENRLPVLRFCHNVKMEPIYV
ncbi:B3 domain-containing protein REM10 [Cardamine amara subsp. amara]|uniref:B3 domain-containing protein REM10 n=1 Tax=Cardamine amara subsp. amara TaxID=228776 RepID=A0ABD1BEL6_CARAN